MSYNYLTIEEGACIYQFLNLGMSIRKIAQALRRAPSTISREIKRNSSKTINSRGNYTKYFPIKANEKYIDRRKECHRKSKFSKNVIDYLTIKINEHWSPEQIIYGLTKKRSVKDISLFLPIPLLGLWIDLLIALMLILSLPHFICVLMSLSQPGIIKVL
ncbi:helix-turn-helix domain-containing protein [Anaerococcus sp.]|uniref:helix-turn-helix domain-containing protein n=1 Tax=Anaerococcus sp. TaxID=1872515 RepID=UPI0027B8CED6|nr:helix-turn-helix domain-containing protein [Anaerococcus sp.]